MLCICIEAGRYPSSLTWYSAIASALSQGARVESIAAARTSSTMSCRSGRPRMRTRGRRYICAQPLQERRATRANPRSGVPARVVLRAVLPVVSANDGTGGLGNKGDDLAEVLPTRADLDPAFPRLFQ